MCWQGRMHACWGPRSCPVAPLAESTTCKMLHTICGMSHVAPILLNELACRRFLKRQVCASCLQAAAWQHFLNSGIHEGRPHRFTC
jgi:hypothetical protein